MQTFTVEEAARRWLSAPKLDPETEREAAEATIAFLTDVRSKIEAHLEDIKAGRAPADGSGLQEVWDFSHFDPKHIDFLLATLGEGEVRIKLFGGEAKAGDTSVPGLWRVQSGRSGQENFFVLARLPRTVQVVGTRGLDKIPQLVNPSADVFAAPAILQELQYRLDAFDADAGVPDMPTDPCFMLELKRQPLSPGDMTALLSTLGQGDIDVELQGILVLIFRTPKCVISGGLESSTMQERRSSMLTSSPRCRLKFLFQQKNSLMARQNAPT